MIPDSVINSFLSGKSPGTKRLYKHGISLFQEIIVKDIPITDINERHFTDFCEWLETQDLSPASRHSYAKGTRRLLRYLSRNHLSDIRTDFLLENEKETMEKIPDDDYELPKGTKEFAVEYHNQPLPPRESRKVYLDFLRDRAFIGVLEATGSRITAAIQIKVSKIKWDTDPVKISIIGKNKRRHVLRLDSRQARYLKQWLAERGKANDYVFPAIRGKGHLNDGTGRKILRRWIKRIFGKKYDFTPHAFRHLFVTRMRDKHGLEMAQLLVDHKSISTTARYPDARKEVELDKAYKQAMG
jgi:integrase